MKKPPLTNEEFIEFAKPLPITIGNETVSIEAQSFKTGSVGWMGNPKVKVSVETPCGLVEVECSVILTVVVSGSKYSAKT